ncbi:MAG: hypothetical protein HY687_03725 [Chloroflexi bacterium]|nr:hypothetical protein [Chloroflexota bacterium]
MPAVIPGLPRTDDFSDPAKGLFPDKQHGTVNRVSPVDGKNYSFQWSYGYEDGALVGRSKGYYPETMPGAANWIAPAAGKMSQDFAVQVHAQVTKGTGQTGCLIRYDLGSDGHYQFGIFPDEQWYEVRRSNLGPDLAGGKSNAIKMGSGDNEMRLELQGDTLRAYVNGQLLASIRNEGLAQRGGVVQLNSQVIGRIGGNLVGHAPDDVVETRFTNFRLSGL